MIKNGVYEFYFVSCMNIVFNELRQQRVKYDVHTTSKIKHTRYFLSNIIFSTNLSAILIGTIQGRSQEFVFGGINFDQSVLSRNDNALF